MVLPRGRWIPLCCLVVPSVHFLSREVVVLQRRVKKLEQEVGSVMPASKIAPPGSGW